MVVKFAFPDAREWKYIVQSLAALITEANFIADEEGLRLRALDPSRVAMVDLFMPREAFDEYVVEAGEGEEKVKIGVNFDELNDVLKRGKSDDRVVLTVEEGRLKVVLSGKAERIFSLPLIDIAGEEYPTPKVEFKVLAKMLSDTLKDAMNDAKLVSDTVRFTGEAELLRLFARSDKGEVEARFSLDAGSLLEYEVNDPPQNASYGVDYLLDMLKKASRVSDIVTVEFSSNKPLSLSFDITGGGVLRFFLAPRVEAEV